MSAPTPLGAAIVTGSAQALGRAYALRFAADGRPVVIADRNLPKAREVAAEIAHTGGRAIAVQVDISDEASCDAMREESVAAFHTVDVLVNNAAYFSSITPKPFWELTVDEWDAAMTVNLKGTWLASRAIAPVMRSQRSGSIINVASAANFMGRPNYAHYVSSKAGIVGLTRAMARELGRDNVRVNCIAPGGVVTEIRRKTMTDADVETLVGMQSIKRPTMPDDVVGYVAFLASAESAMITGQTLIIDGGLHFQ